MSFELTMPIYETFVNGECIAAGVSLDRAKNDANKLSLDWQDDWGFDDEGQTWVRLYQCPETLHILPVWIEVFNG